MNVLEMRQNRLEQAQLSATCKAEATPSKAAACVNGSERLNADFVDVALAPGGTSS
jgi:hypothetical protein